MKPCGCGGASLLAGASIASHPMVLDQPMCPAPAPDKLAAVDQVLFPREKKSAQFRLVKTSNGQDLLEVEISGKIRWVPLLTSKP